jgi:hypothetical protein
VFRRFQQLVQDLRDAAAQSEAMRFTLLSCALLALTATTAAAQTLYVGPWRPRPTIGIGLGAFGAITRNGSASLVRSGTLEVPLAEKARIRVEYWSSALAIMPVEARPSSVRTDTAHLQRLSIGIAGLKQPGAPVTVYAGVGVGLSRARFDYAPGSQIGVGAHVQIGAEVMLSDKLTLDAELGLNGFKYFPRYQRNLNTGEAVLRIKMVL